MLRKQHDKKANDVANRAAAAAMVTSGSFAVADTAKREALKRTPEFRLY